MPGACWLDDSSEEPAPMSGIITRCAGGGNSPMRGVCAEGSERIGCERRCGAVTHKGMVGDNPMVVAQEFERVCAEAGAREHEVGIHGRPGFQ